MILYIIIYQHSLLYEDTKNDHYVETSNYVMIHINENSAI